MKQKYDDFTYHKKQMLFIIRQAVLHVPLQMDQLIINEMEHVTVTFWIMQMLFEVNM